MADVRATHDRPPGCALMGDGTAWTGDGLGVGTYRARMQVLIVTLPDGTEEEFY